MLQWQYNSINKPYFDEHRLQVIAEFCAYKVVELFNYVEIITFMWQSSMNYQELKYTGESNS